MGSSDGTDQLPAIEDSAHRRRAALTGVVALLAVFCFASTLGNDFCHDDVPIVEFNPQVVGPASWGAIWTTDYWGGAGTTWERRDLLYRPVAVTSYRIVQTLIPFAAGLQHCWNVVLHALVSMLVMRLAYRFTEDGPVAFVSGLLFAALPIHSEVVASVVGRADILAALGVVVAMLAHCQAMEAKDGRGRFFWSLGAAAAIFLAMGSKESGVVAAVCVVAADWFFHRRMRAERTSVRWLSAATLGRLWYVATPVVVYSVLRVNALDGFVVQSAPLTKTINVLSGAPIWQRLLGTIQLWGMYWVKTGWPQVLNIDYSINAVRLATGVLDLHVLAGIVVFFTLGVWGFRRFRAGDATVGFLFLLCVLCYLPTSNALVLLQAFFAERIWYLPSVWVVMLIAVAIGPFLRRVDVRVLLTIALAAMTGRCVVRNGDWKNNRTLSAAACRDHPNGAQALRLYGQALVGTGEVDRGISHLRRAIEIDLGYTDAYRDLGLAFLRAGRFGEALDVLQTAEMQVPGHGPTVAALGEARRAVIAGRGDAVVALRQRVAESPDDVAGQLLLVKMLRETADLSGAIAYLREHDSRFGRDARWAYEYAITLVMQNDLDGSILQYRRAVDLDSEHVGANVELAMLLLERDTGDDIAQAWDHVRRVERIAPDDVGVLVCRGELLAHDGKTIEAIEAYRRAVANEPDSSPRRNALVARLRTLGG